MVYHIFRCCIVKLRDECVCRLVIRLLSLCNVQPMSIVLLTFFTGFLLLSCKINDLINFFHIFTPILTPFPHHSQLGDDSDNDVLRHNPSSSSRTKFTVQTPETEKAAIQNLKTKMNFSDHSVSCQYMKVQKAHLPQPIPNPGEAIPVPS